MGDLGGLHKVLHELVVVGDEEALVGLHVLLGLDVLDGDQDLGVLDPLHHLGLPLQEPGPTPK